MFVTKGVERADSFVDRAKELRAMAKGLNDAELKKLLREVAEEYEAMAERIASAARRL